MIMVDMCPFLCHYLKNFPVDNQNEFAILNKQLVMTNYDCLGDQVIFRKILLKLSLPFLLP